MTTTPTIDGWIEWSGGPCPVEPDTIVRVQIRADTRERADRDHDFDEPAGDWRWDHQGTRGDIIAYRIVRSV
jgi:hypothetical protein